MDIKKLLQIAFAPERKIKQKINYFSSILNFKFKKIRLTTYPIRLTIDPSNFCNLKCALCPVGTKTPGRKQSFMDFDVFRKIIDECGDYLWKINLFNWGEPLLNNQIFEMIKYAKKKKIEVSISTNLNVFNDTICTELITSGLDNLIVSLDGASQESVEKYQTGSNFELVKNNIKCILDKKIELKAIKPIVTWRFLVNKFNENDINRAVDLSKQWKVDELEINHFRCNMAKEIFWDNKSQYEDVKSWLPVDENLSMYDYKKEEKKIIKKRCGLLWYESVIHPNGSVSPCCAIWPEKYDFGNISNNSFKEIWNNEQYQNARRISLSDDISINDHICHICKTNNAMI